MEDDRKAGIQWNQVLAGAAVSAVLTLVVGIALYHYQRRSPKLIYDVLPPAYFATGDARVGIYHARVVNRGEKEAEDVTVVLSIAGDALVRELNIEPSSKALEYTVDRVAEKDPKNRRRTVRFPTLNPDEGAVLSVLTEGGEGSVTVEARGKGVVGTAIASREGPSFLESAFGTLAGTCIGLVPFLLFAVRATNRELAKVREERDAALRELEARNSGE